MGSIVLDGIDDYISQNYYTSTNFVNNQSWTIDALINVVSSQSAGNTRGGVLTNQRYQTESDPGGFGLNIINQTYCINLTSGSTGNAISYQQISSIPINYNKNERITAIWDSGSSTAKLYRNGTLINAGTSTSYGWSPRSVGPGLSQAIGTSTQGGWGYVFPMKLYNVSLYNRALTQSEINQNYYQAPIVTNGLVLAVDAGNLVSYESGSTTSYSMTGSLSGSLINGTGYSNVNGGIWNFDGVDDYVQINYGGNLSSDTITLNFFAKHDGPNSGRRTMLGLSNGGNAAYFTYDMQIWDSDSQYLSFVGDGTTYTSYTFNIPNTFQVWNHFAVVISPTTIKNYLNGQLVYNSTAITLRGIFDRIWLGTRSGQFWKGWIPNFQLYNRELSATEVLQNYNAQKGRFGL